jgi:nucleotide-binding universal stress UspA family protein
LEAEVAQLADEGVEVVLRVMSPRRSAVDEIVRAAEIHDVDVIVCGTRGFRGAVQGRNDGRPSTGLPSGFHASCGGHRGGV